MNVEINISQDNATPAIAAKMAQCNPSRLAKIVRDPLRAFWRDHLKRLPANKRGWPSTGFWEDAADSVDAVIVGTDVVLRGDKLGLSQRYHGGFIKPVNRDALTIPISPVSYGRKASEFPGLFLLRTKKGAYLVQRGEGVSEKTGRVAGIGRKGGGNAVRRRQANLNFLFKLSPGVNQKPNPAVIPSADEFMAVAMAAIEGSVN